MGRPNLLHISIETGMTWCTHRRYVVEKNDNKREHTKSWKWLPYVRQSGLAGEKGDKGGAGVLSPRDAAGHRGWDRERGAAARLTPRGLPC